MQIAYSRPSSEALDRERRAPRSGVAALELVRAASAYLALVTTGLIAGFFYAYACSVSLGLARLDDAGYIAAMQEINEVVVNPIFAFGFFGAAVALVVAAALHRRTPRFAPLAVAAAVYLVVAFALTAAFNVPLNDELATVDLAAGAGTLRDARAAYEDEWNAWNWARTVAATVALIAVGVALTRRASPGRPRRAPSTPPSAAS